MEGDVKGVTTQTKPAPADLFCSPDMRSRSPRVAAIIAALIVNIHQKEPKPSPSCFTSYRSCPKIGSVGCIPLNPWIFIISFIIFLVIFRHLFELLLVVQCWDIFFEQILGVSDYADHYYRHPELWNHQISRIDVHPAYKGRPAAKKYNKMFFVFKADLYKP